MQQFKIVLKSIRTLTCRAYFSDQHVLFSSNFSTIILTSKKYCKLLICTIFSNSVSENIRGQNIRGQNKISGAKISRDKTSGDKISGDKPHQQIGYVMQQNCASGSS